MEIIPVPTRFASLPPLSTDVLVAWGGSENSLAETPAAFSKASSQSITSVTVLGRALTALLLVSLYN